MGRPENPDILIIGGGPAGCAAAIVAAKAGLSVALLNEPQDPAVIRPGEALHPGLESLLDQLGVRDAFLAADFQRFPGHHVLWDGPVRYNAFGEDETGAWQGFQAWRAQFDALLLQEAENHGGLVYRDCRARNLRCDATGRPRVVVTDSGEITAQVIVDASGGRRWLSRRLELTLQLHSPRLVAWFAYIENNGHDLPVCPLFAADPEGWTWTAAVAPKRLQWVRLRFDNHRLDREVLETQRGKARLLRDPSAAEVTWQDCI